MATTFSRIQLLGDTAANFVGFVPAFKEPVFETDTGRLKVGDGVTLYQNLPYFDEQVQGLLTYATVGEAIAGIEAAKPIAPSVASAVYLQKDVTAAAQSVGSTITFQGPVTVEQPLTIDVAPSTNVHAVRKLELDGRFTTTDINQGTTDAGKAAILNASGQIDASRGRFLPIPIRGFSTPYQRCHRCRITRQVGRLPRV